MVLWKTRQRLKARSPARVRHDQIVADELARQMTTPGSLFIQDRLTRLQRGWRRLVKALHLIASLHYRFLFWHVVRTLAQQREN